MPNSWFLAPLLQQSELTNMASHGKDVTPRVLVVDDSPTLLKMMVTVLARKYDCLTASNGEECIRMAREEKPDAILMDVVMPDKSGIEVARELSKIQETKDVPVVLVTSTMVSSDDLTSGLQSGALDYIRRPFNEIELLARVATAIRLKQSFDSLKKQNEELVELNKMKSDFLAIASHDLRSPFTSILGLTEILTDFMPDPLTPAQKEVIGTIHTSAEVQLTYVNDLLSLAMSQSGNVSIEKESLDFRTILENSRSLLKPIADSKKITIEIEGGGSRNSLVDKSKIIQVVNNLLTNAIKFSYEGSTICLGIEELTAENHELRGIVPSEHLEEMVKRERFLVISIQDEGVGVPEEEIPKLFQNFQQKLKRRGTKGEIGTGLGLAICKSIVEMHGGTIWAKRNGNRKGTTFRFTVPCA